MSCLRYLYGRCLSLSLSLCISIPPSHCLSVILYAHMSVILYAPKSVILYSWSACYSVCFICVILYAHLSVNLYAGLSIWLFVCSSQIKLDTLLCSQGVVGNSRVYLHIPIIGGQPATVRVTNIAKTVTEEELREKFRLFGRIFHLNLIQSAREATNHCFVKYPSEEIAQQAIDDMNNEVISCLYDCKCME